MSENAWVGTAEWSFSYGDIEIKIVARVEGDNVVFDIQNVSEDPDLPFNLTGFFIDYDNNGGDITSVGSPNNNMHGAGDGFDFAKVLGIATGRNKTTYDANESDSDVVISIADLEAAGVMSMEQLADAEIGLRAQQVGFDKEDSFKLTAEGDYVPPYEPEDPTFNFPEWPQDISNTVLVFNQEMGDKNGDDLYMVKIDEWPGCASNDLTDSIGDILAWLVAYDDNITEDSVDNFAGAWIKGGGGPGGSAPAEFFGFGEYDDDNGDGADPWPFGPPPEINPGGNVDPALIDQTWDFSQIFGDDYCHTI